MAEPRKVFFPDIEQPLPLAGLVALVQRTVAIQSQGSASDPVPILDGIDRIRAFEISEDSFRIPAVRVNQVPIREYIYGDLLSHVLGFMGPIPAFAADDYQESGYNNPNEKVGLNGLEFSYQDELRGEPGVRFSERDIVGVDVRTVGDVVEPVPGLESAPEHRSASAADHVRRAQGEDGRVGGALGSHRCPQPAEWRGAGHGQSALLRQQHLCRAHRRRLPGTGAGRASPLDQLCHRRPLPARLDLQDGDGGGGSGRRCHHAGDGRHRRRADLPAQPLFPQRRVAGAEVRELESQERRRARSPDHCEARWRSPTTSSFTTWAAATWKISRVLANGCSASGPTCSALARRPASICPAR